MFQIYCWLFPLLAEKLGCGGHLLHFFKDTCKFLLSSEWHFFEPRFEGRHECRDESISTCLLFLHVFLKSVKLIKCTAEAIFLLFRHEISREIKYTLDSLYIFYNNIWIASLSKFELLAGKETWNFLLEDLQSWKLHTPHTTFSVLRRRLLGAKINFHSPSTNSVQNRGLHRHGLLKDSTVGSIVEVRFIEYCLVIVQGRPLHYKTCMVPRTVYQKPGFEYVVPLVTK